MSKKSIINEFISDIDMYSKDTRKINQDEDKEYKDLLEIGRVLANKDFSMSSNKEAVFNKTVKNINNFKGDCGIRKINKIGKAFITAASLLIVCFAFTQTSFARGLAQKIVNSINIGNSKVIQVQINKSEVNAMLNSLKGKIFDKDGNPVSVLANDTKVYTAEGKEINGISKDGKLETVPKESGTGKVTKLIIKDASKFNDYTCFKIILPTYLPKDYKLDRAELYRNENGEVSKKYIDLYFNNEKNGKFIYMQQRFSDAETAYVSSTDGKIEKVKVNNSVAAITDGRSIDWEANNVIYGLSGRGQIEKTELIKIAESIK